MKTKTLILTVIFSLCFANVCEAQFNLGKVISTGVSVGKALKEAKKKQKQLQSISTTNADVDGTQNATNNNNHAIENPKDEIKLIVSADGATKEEATKIALRSAIEQAYGAFVSANTTILNDEMVKDEIVTISNGNIKSYQEVASALLPNGRTTVTLDAIVSISKITSYAQSKGATTEFAGATFAMNVKMMELNKQNEMKVLDNLVLQVKEILPTAFDLELVVDEPRLYEYDGPLGRYSGKLNMNDYFVLPFSINFRDNENLITLYKLIKSTLKSLEPNQEECDYFKDHGMTRESRYTILGLITQEKRFDEIRIPSGRMYKTRLNYEEITKYDIKFNDILIDFFSDFEIVDNTGTKSSFDAKSWAMYFGSMNDRRLRRDRYKIEQKAEADHMSFSYYHGTGIFNPLVALYHNYTHSTKRNFGRNSGFREFCRQLYPDQMYGFPLSDNGIAFHFAVLIPKEDISKYSNFTVQHKTKK